MSSFPDVALEHSIVSTGLPSSVAMTMEGSSRQVNAPSAERGCKLSDRLRQLGYGSSKLYVLKNLLRAGRVFVDGAKEFEGSRRVASSAVFRVVPDESHILGQHHAESSSGGAKSLGMQVEIIGPTLLLYNKPCGRLSALSDKGGALHIDIPRQFNKTGLHHVGRLDQHSTGLLLLTDDGHLTKRLIDPRSQIPREYVCVVCGEVDLEQLRAKLAAGVETRFGVFYGTLLEAKPFEGSYEHQQCCSNCNMLPHRQDGPPMSDEAYEQQLQQQSVAGLDCGLLRDCSDSENSDERSVIMADNSGCVLSEVRLQVTEGKKREVRRMLAYSGHVVLNLRRESFGLIRLGDLRMGDLRKATLEEMNWAVGLL